MTVSIEKETEQTRPALDTVWTWLESLNDPEIPVISIIDLGIIRNVAWSGDTLEVDVTPTYSGCPATSFIAQDIEALLRKRGIIDLRIRKILSPPWTTEWLSAKGRVQLEKYGISPPQSSGRPRCCPLCGSTDVIKVSEFGSTPCKAQWRCRTCLEPFDYFKCI
ncbi:MAG: phenylacetate-CoA oxygenase subunit PaaJ [Aestuariivita sp.]|nr:phenylacetate-CoA oxygenase subunit PaaJ [Aestuariivita sp.]